ncbi:MAG: ABC transporter substrate-binding protein, partial [Pseudomonadales bacterium]
MFNKKTNSVSAKTSSCRKYFGLALKLIAFMFATSNVQFAIAQSSESLVTSHPQDPQSWDYWSVSATAISAVTFINVRQPLLEVLADGSLAPLLAESWDISEDGLTVTFNIREAKFSDGTALDSNDVVYSLLKNKESPLGSIAVPLSVVNNVTAVDNHTVQLHLSKPSQRLMTELGKRSGIIVPEGAFENLNAANEVVGTGPYIFSEYNPGVDVKLVRN